MTTIPPLPTYPGADAGDAALAEFEARLELHRSAVAEFIATTPQPKNKPTRAELAARFVEALAARPIQALGSAPTAASLVATAGQIADAYISANPGATEG